MERSFKLYFILIYVLNLKNDSLRRLVTENIDVSLTILVLQNQLSETGKEGENCYLFTQ